MMSTFTFWMRVRSGSPEEDERLFDFMRSEAARFVACTEKSKDAVKHHHFRVSFASDIMSDGNALKAWQKKVLRHVGVKLSRGQTYTNVKRFDQDRDLENRRYMCKGNVPKDDEPPQLVFYNVEVWDIATLREEYWARNDEYIAAAEKKKKRKTENYSQKVIRDALDMFKTETYSTERAVLYVCDRFGYDCKPWKQDLIAQCIDTVRYNLDPMFRETRAAAYMHRCGVADSRASRIAAYWNRDRALGEVERPESPLDNEDDVQQVMTAFFDQV